MKKFFVLLLCCLSFYFSSYCKAEENVKIGVVDLNALLMLHPKMADFDAYNRAFKIKKEENTKERQNQLVEDRGEFYKLRKETKILLDNIDQVTNKRDEDIYNARKKYEKKIEGKIDKGLLAQEEKIYELEIDKIEKEFLANYRNYVTKLGINERKIASLKKYITDPDYTSEEETRKKLKEISDEVHKLIAHVGKKKGLALVINTSIERTIKNIENEVKPNRLYSDISYRTMLTGDFISDENEDEANLKAHRDFYYSGLKDVVQRYLNSYNIVVGELGVGKASIYIGGQDITKDVLKLLLKKYKVSDRVSEILFSSLDY